MADPVLGTLHSGAVAWRIARFELLLRQEPFRALFGRLMMAPPSVPVPRSAAQFMAQYANLTRQIPSKAP
jgi:hypothetical protein